MLGTRSQHREAMSYSTPKDPFKAIFAIRERVFQEHVYQTRGMACAVNVGGSDPVRLVTWRGVIGESDCINKAVVMDRFSEKFFNNVKRYRVEKSTVKESGSFSFLSVNASDNFNTVLEFIVPGNEIKKADLIVKTFSGKEKLELNFKYDKSKGKHNITCDEWRKRVMEKSFVLGSPVMFVKDKHTVPVVVGVVGVNDGNLVPCFITEKEFSDQEKDPTESLNSSSSQDGQSFSSAATDQPKEEKAFNGKPQLVTDNSGSDCGLKGEKKMDNKTSLVKHLADFNRVIDDTAKDGNCAFRSIVRVVKESCSSGGQLLLLEHLESLGFLKTEEDDIKTLRNLFAEEIQKENEEFLPFIPDQDQKLLAKRAEEFKQNGVWDCDSLGDLVMKVCAHVLMLPIVVVTSNEGRPYVSFRPSNALTSRCVYVAYHCYGSHYDATTSMEDQPKEEEAFMDKSQLVTWGQGRTPKGLNVNSSQGNDSSASKDAPDAKLGSVTESSEKGSVTESSEKVRSDAVPLEYLPYLALDIQDQGEIWKSVGRSLMLTPADLNGIQNENVEQYERCYKMVKRCHEKGSASYKNLADALQDHVLHSIREDYCLEEHDPPTRKNPEKLENVKVGPVSDGELQRIALAVKGKRKRLGRALGVTDNQLDSVVEENRQDDSEQSYQILRKWKSAKGRGATYNELAQALLDRTVDMRTVMEKYCLNSKRS